MSKMQRTVAQKMGVKAGSRGHLVESTCLRVDDIWAALKFTHPKPGKTYRNSYGTLPDATLRKVAT